MSEIEAIGYSSHPAAKAIVWQGKFANEVCFKLGIGGGNIKNQRSLLIFLKT
jgi:hypothetical protein